MKPGDFMYVNRMFYTFTGPPRKDRKSLKGDAVLVEDEHLLVIQSFTHEMSGEEYVLVLTKRGFGYTWKEMMKNWRVI